MKNVLVFPCGSEIGLEVYRALKYSKDFKLYGGSSVKDHGVFVYENYIEDIPYVDDQNFVCKINDIINDYKIDLIIPAHDSVVLKLAQNSDKINAIIVTSPAKTCEICRSKGKTYEKLKNIILIPKVFSRNQLVSADFPIFIKPDVGQGSKGTRKINFIEELDYWYNSDDILLLEYLPGKEYTIDCFTDYKGNLLYCSGRERRRISNGISVNAIEIKNEIFIEIAKKINSYMIMNGAWFFQVKERSNGELVLMEIAPRIAGTMEFQRTFGVNLPLLSLYNAQHINLNIVKNDYEIELDRALESKFRISINYNYIYIDLDDTLIINKKVNYLLLAFLYKCLNEKKNIILLTRHKYDPMITLEKYNIANIFLEIIHLSNGEKKSSYIEYDDSIFIDDSFSERNDVYCNKKIPVFDVNMIDILL